MRVLLLALFGSLCEWASYASKHTGHKPISTKASMELRKVVENCWNFMVMPS